jgi:ABC-2 type transport system permease protein
LSLRLRSAYVPPQFAPPELITLEQADARLDRGRATFVLVIPTDFQRRVLAGRPAELQLNVDTTLMSQAFTGGSYVQQIALGEIAAFKQRVRMEPAPAVELSARARFNPALAPSWFGGRPNWSTTSPCSP